MSAKVKSSQKMFIHIPLNSFCDDDVMYIREVVNIAIDETTSISSESNRNLKKPLLTWRQQSSVSRTAV